MYPLCESCHLASYHFQCIEQWHETQDSCPICHCTATLLATEQVFSEQAFLSSHEGDEEFDNASATAMAERTLEDHLLILESWGPNDSFAHEELEQLLVETAAAGATTATTAATTEQESNCTTSTSIVANSDSLEGNDHVTEL